MESMPVIAQLQGWDYRTYIWIAFMIVVGAILAMATVAAIAGYSERKL